jgi:PAS domain S-box-containing protein
MGKHLFIEKSERLPDLVSPANRTLSGGERTQDALYLRDRALEAISVGVFLLDLCRPNTPIIDVNPAFERITGYARNELLGRSYDLLHGPDSNPATIAEIREAIRQKRAWSGEVLNYRKDGSPWWNELSLGPVPDAANQVIHFVGVHRDTTQRKHLEEQFRQAQKLGAVGLFSSSIAHDFNNLLTVILGCCDVLLGSLLSADAIGEALQQIKKAAEDAACLTRQLLTIGRRHEGRRRLLDLNAVVADIEKMLRRLIGEDIVLTTATNPGLGWIEADPGHIEQILLNLAVNARDAMAQGGRLTIELANVELYADSARSHTNLPPGPYVLLVVSDTGCGMSEEVQRQLFHPFFTTKQSGKGTGLGLYTVQTIVRQIGGDIQVSSKAGHGTRVEICLPRIEKVPPTEAPEKDSGRLGGGSETVLLVEDNLRVRDMIRTVLRQQGYTILEAGHATEALAICDQRQAPIHLLIADAFMPQMSGAELAGRLIPLRPDMKILLLSGHELEPAAGFLLKPFGVGDLLRKVREVLDQGSSQALPPSGAN